ncbi:MAG: hemolysin family protein [Anaerolineaceae bacterium]|nr:hemolysin family protein [Anaerolineaceae bacterium]
MTPGNILLIIILILLNAFFVATEFAIVSSRRSRLDLIADSDNRAARLVRAWLDQSSARERLIAAAQLGITLVSLALGAVGENTFESWLEPIFHNANLPSQFAFVESIFPILPLIISLTVVTSLHVILGEQVPKVTALRFPERLALFSAIPMDIFSKIFKVFVNLLDWATRMILGLMGLPPDNPHSTVYSLAEIKEIVSGPEIDGVMEEQEREMISAIIDFGGLLVRHVSIPRTEIIAVEADTNITEVINLAMQHGLTKMPVYEDNLDQVIGVVHLRDLVRSTQEDESNGSTARDLMRDALFVPETITANQLLHHFRIRSKHMAIVLDEFGGTMGLVTLEDLVEEIIGDVQDPFETSLPPIQTLPDGTSLIDGMTLIEEVNEQFKLNLIDTDYDTIAGFVLGKLGRIAKVGDFVDDQDNYIRLKVKEMDALRISQVILYHLEGNPEVVPQKDITN